MNSPLPLLIANHKASKTWDEVDLWIDEVAQAATNFRGTIIFCPSYPFLAAAYKKISQNSINVKLGAQDVSIFEQGAYTGEVAASQIANLVKFAIIGHSERRKNFHEDEKVLEQKTVNTQKAGIEPIFCVPDEKSPVPKSVGIVAYEPPAAISTGDAQPADQVEAVLGKIRGMGDIRVLYGGSVSAENVGTYLKTAKADGVLVGATNSLDAQKFIAIVDSLK